MADLSYPSLYQINRRVWLTDLFQAAEQALDPGRYSGRGNGPSGSAGF